MSDFPKKCSHGVRLEGPDTPRCIECEIVWHAEALMNAEQAVARHSVILAALCEEAKRLATRPDTTPEGEP